MQEKTFKFRRMAFVGLALIGSATMLTNCSNEEVFSEASDKSEGVVIYATVGSVDTRASYSAWDANDQIGVYMFETGTQTLTADAYENNPYYTATGNSTFLPLSDDGNMYFPTDGSEVDLIAYYPYSTSAVSDGVYSLDLSDQSDQEAIDLMVSDLVSGKSKDNTTVEMTFTHKLVKLVLNVTPGNGIEVADLATTAVTLTGQNVIATLDVTQADQLLQNISNDGKSVTEGNTTTTLNAGEYELSLLTSATDEGAYAEGIVMPASSTYSDDTDGMQLVFSGILDTSNDDYAFADFTFTLSDVLTYLEAGYMYTFNVTVDRASTGSGTNGDIVTDDDGNYYLDTDDDGEGDVPLTGTDTDGDGVVDTWTGDTDGDGVDDYVAQDTDGDGTVDTDSSSSTTLIATITDWVEESYDVSAN